MRHFQIEKAHFCIALIMWCITLHIHAQEYLPGGFKHIIEVGRYSDYGKGYLTITNVNEVGISKNGVPYISYYPYEYVDDYKDKKDNYLHTGQLILEVDGVSAVGWTKEQFYNKVDNRQDIITLKIRAKKNKRIYDYETQIRPLHELPSSVKVFGNDFASITGQTTPQKRRNLKATYEERHDEDFDFFPCLYYDYLITSNDPLLDKEILKEIPPLWAYYNRNEDTPDLLITIARDANESINSTYIPPTSRVVNVGSKTEVRYNYILHKNEYVTKQENRTIREGGYTKETKVADLFLEIAALDVKKLNDKNMTHPPIVWKATVKRHVIDPNFNLNDELKAYASWMTLPPFDRNVMGEKTFYAPVGIIYSEFVPTIIHEVIAGSRAESIGLQPGDILLKAYMPYAYKYARKNVKKFVKTKGWAMVDTYRDKTYNIEILRNGHKMKYTLAPSPIKVEGYYWIGAE